MVGIGTHDDTGVVQISDDLAIMQTIDFFTPVVDDPYDYGQIAVANSLSDIYAMGAKPLCALNVVGFPIASMDKKILALILKGGWEMARKANVLIIGGHSVKDPEIKYGLAVTALIHPQKIIKNSTARAGDHLILTKPLGTGILTTALKNEKLSSSLLKKVTENMKELNQTASEIMLKHQVNACTDVTGFGLLGHLYEMMHASGTSALLKSEKIPLLPQVLSLIDQKQVPGGLKENFAYLSPFLDIPAGFNQTMLKALCDPQTSGGLLISLPPETVSSCLAELHQNDISAASVIGEVIEKQEKSILLA